MENQLIDLLRNGATLGVGLLATTNIETTKYTIIYTGLDLAFGATDYLIIFALASNARCGPRAGFLLLYEYQFIFLFVSLTFLNFNLSHCY